MLISEKIRKMLVSEINKLKKLNQSYYLIEALNRIKNDEITLELQNSIRPFIIKEDNLMNMILPVKVEE